MKLKVSAVQ